MPTPSSGTWELVWNDKIAKVPIVNGYMPNKEVLTWDLEREACSTHVRDATGFSTGDQNPRREFDLRGWGIHLTVGGQAGVDLGRVPCGRRRRAAVSSATGVNVIHE